MADEGLDRERLLAETERASALEPVFHPEPARIPVAVLASAAAAKERTFLAATLPTAIVLLVAAAWSAAAWRRPDLAAAVVGGALATGGVVAMWARAWRVF
jgi:hypothetical protein